MTTEPTLRSYLVLIHLAHTAHENLNDAITGLNSIDTNAMRLDNFGCPAVLIRTDLTARAIVAKVRSRRDAPQAVHAFELAGDWFTTPSPWRSMNSDAWLTTHLGDPR